MWFRMRNFSGNRGNKNVIIKIIKCSSDFYLVKENEVGVEDRGVEIGLSANSPQVGDHVLFVIGVSDVDRLNQEPGGDDVFSAFVKLDVERERVRR
jgi:hypothetical protein